MKNNISVTRLCICAALAAMGASAIDMNGTSLEVDDATFALDGEYTNSSDTTASLVVTLAEAATFTGTISGNVQLVKKGAGKLTISSSNSFTGGTDIQAGTVGITDADALGTGDVSILGSAAAAGRISLDAAITFTNNISVSSGTASFVAVYFGLTSGTAIYSGDITVTGAMRLRRAAKNGIGRFAGTVRTSGDVTVGNPNNENSWNYYFDGPLIINNGAGTLHHNQPNSATAFFSSPSNDWAYTERYTQGPIFTAPHSVPTNSCLSSNQSGNAPSITFTGDQKFKYIKSKNSDKTVTITASADTAATLTLWPDSSARMNEGYNLNGPLSIVFDPPSDDVEWRIRGGTSSMTGSLTVARGTVLVLTNTMSNVSGFHVRGGATLELGDHCAISTAKGLDISVAEGGTLKLSPEVHLTAARLLLGGNRAKGAMYYAPDAEGNWRALTKDEADALTDTGWIFTEVVAEEETASTWTAGGGLDERMSTSSNWTGGELPDLDGGGLLATFGSAGTNAVVDGAYLLRGIAFNAAEESFALTAAESPAEASISIGADGVVAAVPPDGETRSYSLDVPLTMTSAQYWTVPAGTTLAVHKPISDAAASTAIFKGGTGTLDLCATNSFTGDFTISNGAVRVYSATNAFGAAGGTVTRMQNSGASFAVKADTVIDKDFHFQNAKDKNGWTAMAASTTCEFAGPFRCNTNWRPNFGGKAIFSGGAAIANYFVPTGGRIVFRNTPCSFGTGFNIGGNVRLDIEVGENTYGGGLTANGGTSIHLYAPNVFGASTPVYLGNDNNNSCPMTIHNGADQRVGTLSIARSNASVSADEPMTLTVNQADSRTWAGNISGGVTLVKKGAASVTINRTMSSTGDVAVAEGMLVFGESGRWQGAKSVAASNATISVSSPLTFAEDVVLHTSGTGAVSIAENVTVKAAEWFHEGVRQHYAVYTAANSGGHVTGGGTLVVGKGGTLVIFR